MAEAISPAPPWSGWARRTGAVAALSCVALTAAPVFAQTAAPAPAAAEAAAPKLDLPPASGEEPSGEVYLVGPSEVLRLRVLDWDSVAGEMREWPELSGEYVVGPDGAIVVPFAGRIASEGRRPDDIATDVVEGLRYRLALIERPDATVEVAAWRPVIVTGNVPNPGPIDFTPGLLAAQAVGLAGGLETGLVADSVLQRDAITAQASLVALRSTERRLAARLARLAAERIGQAHVDRASIGPDLIGPASAQGAEWDAILDLEDQVLDVRRSQLAREIEAIDGQVGLFEAEIGALTEKVTAVEHQRELAREAAANAADLAERGLVANQRVLESEGLLAGLESQLLDVSTAILTARQNVAAADRERSELADDRTAEILELSQVADGQLAETRARIDGQVGILGALGLAESTGELGEPRITVLRPGVEGLERIADAALERLQPGDMVEVRPSVSDPAQEAVAAATANGAAGSTAALALDEPAGAAARSSSRAVPSAVGGVTGGTPAGPIAETVR